MLGGVLVMRKVTMREIARELKVSINTVSLVLNNRTGVGEEMRRKVLRTAEQMGYLEQNDKYNTTYSKKNICVLLKKIYFNDMHFYSKVLYGIESEANRLGYDVLVNFIDETDEVPNCIKLKKVCGVIILGSVPEEKVKKIKNYHIPELPIVFVDHTSYEEAFDSVLTDNRIGVYKAVDYLMENGFEKIGFFGDLDYSQSIKERYWGYIEAIRRIPELRDIKKSFDYAAKYSVTIDVEQFVLDKNTEAIINKIKTVRELPEAFVCSNDRAAILLSSALQTMGYKVPKDISVIGFDDMDIGTMVIPRLTTMHVKMKGMGMRALNVLIWRLSNRNAPAEKILMPVELVIRDSVSSKDKRKIN